MRVLWVCTEAYARLSACSWSKSAPSKAALEVYHGEDHHNIFERWKDQALLRFLLGRRRKLLQSGQPLPRVKSVKELDSAKPIGAQLKGVDIVVGNYQQLKGDKLYDSFRRDFFDAVIVDEAHHAEAQGSTARSPVAKSNQRLTNAKTSAQAAWEFTTAFKRP